MQSWRIKVIVSLVFFSLFVFTNLTLFISQFSHSFSHLFLIFIRDGQFFDYMSVILFFCGFMLCGIFVIISSWHKTSNTLQRIAMLFLGIVFIYLVVLSSINNTHEEDVMNMLAIEGSIYHREFWGLVLDYLGRILCVTFVYVFFVYIPLIFLNLGIHPNKDNDIGKMLYTMRPSINIIIITLFALSLQPYYYRDNLYVYIDIVAFFIGFGLLIWAMIKHRDKFGFYEYVNFTLLCLGILVCFVCSSVLSMSDNYFNARYMFFIFAFVGWCAEWMYKSITPHQA